MKEPNLAWLLIVPALLLALAAVYFLPQLFGGRPSECAKEPIALSPPTKPELVLYALSIMFEQGIISSMESAADAYAGAQYVFDPDEDGQLEYWVMFGTGVAAEFNFNCALDEEGVPLDLEYEGSRQLQ
jgi:hypothetical protein